MRRSAVLALWLVSRWAGAAHTTPSPPSARKREPVTASFVPEVGAVVSVTRTGSLSGSPNQPYANSAVILLHWGSRAGRRSVSGVLWPDPPDRPSHHRDQLVRVTDSLRKPQQNRRDQDVRVATGLVLQLPRARANGPAKKNM